MQKKQQIVVGSSQGADHVHVEVMSHCHVIWHVKGWSDLLVPVYFVDHEAIHFLDFQNRALLTFGMKGVYMEMRFFRDEKHGADVDIEFRSMAGMFVSQFPIPIEEMDEKEVKLVTELASHHKGALEALMKLGFSPIIDV